VFGGSSLAIVVGVPAGTWLGALAGWRVPFIALAAIALLTGVAIARLLATSPPSQSHAATGSAPDGGRYRLILVTTMLAVGGFYASFTYISAFLTKVSGLAHRDVAIILLATGVASTLGLTSGAALQARVPRRPLAIPVALMATSLFGVWILGRALAPVVGLEALVSLGFGGFVVGAQTGVLVSAPRGADIATAWYSASFNVGIACGPVLGGLALSTIGLRQTALVGGVLATGAVVAAVAPPRPLGRSS
jgi:MFS transporter, DHA1 family, inner membrane transport protein